LVSSDLIGITYLLWKYKRYEIWEVGGLDKDMDKEGTTLKKKMDQNS